MGGLTLIAMAIVARWIAPWKLDITTLVPIRSGDSKGAFAFSTSRNAAFLLFKFPKG